MFFSGSRPSIGKKKIRKKHRHWGTIITEEGASPSASGGQDSTLDHGKRVVIMHFGPFHVGVVCHAYLAS